MTDKDILLNDITYFREKLEYLIKVREGNLVSEDIIEAGKRFNDALNKYNRFLNRTPNKDKG
ncbi:MULTISPECIES: aspartyl-phosphate phosphatase Spo0E family protein [Clostridium]|uniref:Aspartyl-phosphate phosphatase Spo0E family protein n=1 Tax=Clostridium manihotivorum TaxID=2320868 RepID=A0A3R5WZT8_9CLOT|nr:MULTISPECIES: aspartyl-phosphate phosphatase Spo0E family protein [Clostridium]QAA30712.1 aspartyl-phosphate phosphatase Spo0E family protein [Clostridium manihotivorum]